MKICFLDKTPFFYNSNDLNSPLLRGAEIALINLASCLNNLGHSVTVINNCPKNENISNINWININSLDTQLSFDLSISNNDCRFFDKIISKKKKFADTLKYNLKDKYIFPDINKKVRSNNYLLNLYIEPKNKKKFIKHMKKNKIICRTIYEKLLNENKVLKPIVKTNLNNAIKCKKSLVAIPSHEQLSEKQFNFIVKKIKDFQN